MQSTYHIRYKTHLKRFCLLGKHTITEAGNATFLATTFWLPETRAKFSPIACSRVFCYTRPAMSEQEPLPSSITQPHVGEARRVSASQRAAEERYRKSEKGKRVQNESSKRWNRKHRDKGISRSEGVRLWWQRRKQQAREQP